MLGLTSAIIHLYRQIGMVHGRKPFRLFQF